MTALVSTTRKFNYKDFKVKYPCPNKCGSNLKTWHEANGPDDARWVGYCKKCKERFEE